MDKNFETKNGPAAILLNINVEFYFIFKYYYLSAYLITPRNRALLQRVIGFQLVRKIPEYCESGRFVTALTTAFHLSLCQTRLI
jgi:hypothetical protein